MKLDKVLQEISRRQSQREALTNLFKSKYEVGGVKDRIQRSHVNQYFLSELNLSTHHSNINMIRRVLKEIGVTETTINGTKFYRNLKEKDV